MFKVDYHAKINLNNANMQKFNLKQNKTKKMQQCILHAEKAERQFKCSPH